MTRSSLALGALLVAALISPAPAGADALPGCAAVDSAARGTATDCRTVSTDRSGLVFEGRTESVGPHAYRTAVTVLSPGGQESQVITEDTVHGYAPRYLLRDLDGDGRDELLIITSSGGTGGDGMAVWRATADAATLRRAGEMFGFRKFWKTADGFIAQYAHSGAAAGSVSLYEFVDDTLVTVAVLDVQTLDWPDVPPRHQWEINGDTKCGLSTDDHPPGSLAARNQALRDARIDPDTAAQRFCAEPWVANFYR
ncbi:MAG TPA: hypothetical protein VL179_13980 [Mycobacterium sp.]|nr:hypothetical protein [Mycobacterium sp.]